MARPLQDHVKVDRGAAAALTGPYLRGWYLPGAVAFFCDPDRAQLVDGGADDLSPGDATDLVQFELAQDDRTPGRARRVTRQALLDWRLPGLVDAVVLVVSELVTNAVRHGRPPLSMKLSRREEQVRLAVHDGNPTELVGTGSDAAADAESGRGAGIVHVLADEVVVEQVTDGGKIIHAAFGTRPPDPQP